MNTSLKQLTFDFLAEPVTRSAPKSKTEGAPMVNLTTEHVSGDPIPHPLRPFFINNAVHLHALAKFCEVSPDFLGHVMSGKIKPPRRVEDKLLEAKRLFEKA